MDLINNIISKITLEKNLIYDKDIPFYLSYYLKMMYEEKIYELFYNFIKKDDLDKTYWIYKNFTLDLEIKKKLIKNYPIYLACDEESIQVFNFFVNKTNIQINKLENSEKIFGILIKKSNTKLLNIWIKKYGLEYNFRKIGFITACENDLISILSNYDLDKELDHKIIGKGIIMSIENIKIFKYLIDKNYYCLTNNQINKIIVESCKKGLVENLKIIKNKGFVFNSVYFDDNTNLIKILEKQYKKEKDNQKYENTARWLIDSGLHPGSSIFLPIYLEKITE